MTVKGLITAMVTPMRNGSIDEEAVRGLVERLIQKGLMEYLYWEQTVNFMF